MVGNVASWIDGQDVAVMLYYELVTICVKGYDLFELGKMS